MAEVRGLLLLPAGELAQPGQQGAAREAGSVQQCGSDEPEESLPTPGGPGLALLLRLGPGPRSQLDVWRRGGLRGPRPGECQPPGQGSPRPVVSGGRQCLQGDSLSLSLSGSPGCAKYLSALCSSPGKSGQAEADGVTTPG